MKSKSSLIDLIGLEKLRELQERFFQASGFSTSCVDAEGNCISKYSEAAPVCMEVIRNTELGRSRCIESDLRLAADSKNKQDLIIYQCHAGILDALVPIVVKGETLGFIFIGQVLAKPPDKKKSLSYAKEIGADLERYWELFKKLKIVPYEKFEQAANLLFFMANGIASEASLKLEAQEESLELRRAQETLKESEERFYQVFNNMGSGVAIYEAVGDGEDFVFKDINPAGARSGRLEREAHIGRSVQEVYPGVRELGIFTVFQRVWRSGKPEHFPLGLYQDHRISFWVENYIYKLPSGEIVAIYDDVTERKQAEEALRMTNETLRAIIQSSPLAIVASDPEGNVTLWNPAAEKIFGWKESETLGRFLPIIPEDKIDEYRAMRARGLNGEAFTSIEVRRQKKDGSAIDISISTAPLRDMQGRVIGIMSVSADIADAKRTEKEKAQLESQLMQAQKIESVGRLAGGVAHDFNNMLSVILGYAELIKSRLPDGDPLLKDVLEIEKAAFRSRDTTHQLLAFSRKQIFEPRPVDLNDLITRTQKTLARLIGEDIDLRFFPGKDLWKIKVDPSQVDQVLINLAVNARDAMPGGGKLTIETANVRLDEAYCRQHPGFTAGHYVLLGISDDGIGMNIEILAYIFEPFFTTKEIGKGTGLGLATVYGIVKQSGGFINVYSEPGQGTTFKIHLPRIADEHEIEEKAEEIPPAASGSGTVLLVEDDDMVRNMTRAMLEKIGYTVLVAKTSPDALSVCEKKDAPIDLLLTDVVMPEMSGSELRNRVQAIRPEIKVLFMSGYTPNFIVHRGVLEEGVHFIQKPFSMDGLAQKVRDAIGIRGNDRLKGS